MVLQLVLSVARMNIWRWAAAIQGYNGAVCTKGIFNDLAACAADPGDRGTAHRNCPQELHTGTAQWNRVL